MADPATDLAVIAAILSSNLDTAILQDWCFAGEVGLSGEIRPVNRIDIRVSEAEKLGFKRIFVSKYNRRTPELKSSNIDIRFVGKVSELVRELFSGN